MTPDQATVRIGLHALDMMNPFFVWTDLEGRILGRGRTLAKLFAEVELLGKSANDLFAFIRPHVDSIGKIGTQNASVKVRTRPPAGVSPANLSGTAIRLEDGEGLLLMLMPGLEVQRLAEVFSLKVADLGSGDASADLLFLIQSQNHMMQDMLETAALVEEARKAADIKAKSDHLTGLLNRRGLTERLEEVLERTDTACCGLAHLDLDRFKLINDTHGHAAGDAVLEHVAAALKATVVEPAFAGRLGGDEFVVVLPDLDDPARLGDLAETLKERIAEPFAWDEINLRVAATFGLTWVDAGTAVTIDDLLHQADLALLEGKKQGRARISTYDQTVMHAQARLRAVSGELPEALARGEFVPAYHPQIDLARKCLAGVEVLARWQHPERGLLGPGEFLESADYSRVMNDIDSSLRAQAFADLSEWRKSGLAVPRVSLNLSSGALGNEMFEQEIVWQAAEHDIPLADIKLEVLESIFLDRAGTELIERAERLNDIGFRLALDDFGTGHASLSSLISLPIDEIKIDRSFVQGVADSAQLQVLSETVCRMGSKLGLDVVAEGVERVEDLRTLKAFGVSVVQGFLFAKPMLAADFVDWLKDASVSSGAPLGGTAA